MKQIDILAIGDISTDVFIKIKDAEAVCDPDGDHCKLCLNYGGKIPYESVTVCHATGNSSNVAIALSRLGIKSALMSNVGNDKGGYDCLDVLKKENVDTAFIRKENELPTNCHYVLWYKKERTILTKHEKYNYKWINLDEYNSPAWIYLSSLGENASSLYQEIEKYLLEFPKTKLAFQPGTFQIKMGHTILENIYKKTNVFLCNNEEAQVILETDEKDISKLLKKIHKLGPKIVVITDGTNGAYSYDGVDILFTKAFTQNPVESTGAGDAFSAGFVGALYLNKEISTALMWGASNATSVVSYLGPQKGLLDKAQIEEYVKNISEDDKPISLI